MGNLYTNTYPLSLPCTCVLEPYMYEQGYLHSPPFVPRPAFDPPASPQGGTTQGDFPSCTGVDGFSDRSEGICHPFPLLNPVVIGCQYTEVLHIWHPVLEPTFN